MLARSYTEWFDLPDVIIVYPVYMMNASQQTYVRTGYRATLNRKYKETFRHILFEMNCRDHTLVDVCDFINQKRSIYPQLCSLTVMYVDPYAPENAVEIDLTNQETMLLSFLKLV
jgi:hypothetical protein